MVSIGLHKLSYREWSIGTIVWYGFPEFVMTANNPKFGSMNIGLNLYILSFVQIENFYFVIGLSKLAVEYFYLWFKMKAQSQYFIELNAKIFDFRGGWDMYSLELKRREVGYFDSPHGQLAVN